MEKDLEGRHHPVVQLCLSEGERVYRYNDSARDSWGRRKIATQLQHRRGIVDLFLQSVAKNAARMLHFRILGQIGQWVTYHTHLHGILVRHLQFRRNDPTCNAFSLCAILLQPTHLGGEGLHENLRPVYCVEEVTDAVAVIRPLDGK